MVTVKDILFLNSLRSARIAAGKDGLLREIRRVSFIDCPLEDITINDTKHLKAGDLYINSLYMFRNSEDDIYKLFQFYIDSQSSGSIVINEYINELPCRVIELASLHHYPILFIEPTVPYADIIREVSTLLFAENSKILYESKIDCLLSSGVTPSEIRELWDYFNPGAEGSYCALYCEIPALVDEKKIFIDKLRKEKAISTFYYRHGFFIIINRDPSSELQVIKEDLLATLGSIDAGCRLGISKVFSKINTFHLSIRQAFSAFEIAKCINTPVLNYHDIGIYNILHKTKDIECLHEFCENTLGTLANHDRLYGTMLLNTVSTFISLDGSYSKTAKELFQHENTIRFRIDKAKKLLGLTNKNYEFIEALSTALKAARLLNIYETKNTRPL